ncbi:MAG: hypothetical protein JNK77_20675 [Saprospiraceae bacterium]|nr:hypothetical protein [Saprospiraceae bacterium]
MVRIFDQGNDQAYFDWMNENPNGFVLNMRRGEGNSFFMIHRSGCSHISPFSQYDDKAYTGKVWIKIVSNDVAEIEKYCAENYKKFPGTFRVCKHCRPEYMPQEITYPDELEEDDAYIEGAKKTVTVNAYERDPKARAKCIAHYGCRCLCCGFDFEEKYGEIGKGFIHVHHLVEIHTVGQSYKVDPKKD